MDAVDSCDATRLEELLKATGDISKCHLDFTTVSNVRSQIGVKCGRRLTYVFSYATPLCLAVTKAHTGIVEQLICAGASVNYTGSIIYTPLMLSAAHGHKDTCLLLLV